MGERDDANAEEALAGSEAVGEAEEEAEVEDEEGSPEEVECHFHVELRFDVEVKDGGLMELAEVKFVFDEILHGDFCRNVDECQEKDVESKGPEAAGEGGELSSGERVGEMRLVGIEEAGALVERHRDNIAGLAWDETERWVRTWRGRRQVRGRWRGECGGRGRRGAWPGGHRWCRG